MKNVLADRLGTTEKVCTLCGDEDENSMHLFKNRQAVRALAFGSWGLRMDNWNVNLSRILFKATVNLLLLS